MTGKESVDAPLHTNFTFRPFTKEYQTKVAARIGRKRPKQNLYSEDHPESESFLINRYPLELCDAEGDGACLPRCISLAVFGTEKYHQMLRNKVVDFLIHHHLPCEPEIRGNDFQSKMKEMRKRKTNMTTREVEGFAFLLDCPIYTCVQAQYRGKTYFAWQRLPHEASTVQVGGTRGIYLLNADVHFQLVMQP